MKAARVLLLTLMLALCIAAASSPQRKQYQLPDEFKDQLVKASAGETAAGEVVKVDKDILILNLTPCAKQAHRMSFHKPYDREAAGQKDCGDGKVHKIEEVTQN